MKKKEEKKIIINKPTENGSDKSDRKKYLRDRLERGQME